MHLLLKIVAKTLTQKPAVCLLLLLSLPSALSSQTRIVNATIDTVEDRRSDLEEHLRPVSRARRRHRQHRHLV